MKNKLYLIKFSLYNNQGGVIISDSKIKVIIIDDNVELCKSIANYLNNNGNFEIISIAHDGKTGLKNILDNKPDVVILDILLPETDGISILEHFYNNNYNEKPIFLMLTAVGQETITRKVLDLGADYVILKPFDMDILMKRVFELYTLKGKIPENEFFADSVVQINKEELVVTTLQKIGIPSNLKGYNFLKIAILICIDDPKLLESITKLLYPAIAKECSTTPSRVERDIRHALEVAWGKGKGEYYYEFIGYTNSKNEKPTNGAFISSLVERLRTQV